jgi:hypothetical protein
LPSPHGLHYALLGIWERFDTLWFLHIAQHGYDRPMAVIFYPLYPAAIRIASGLMPAMAAALLVSTVAARRGAADGRARFYPARSDGDAQPPGSLVDRGADASWIA